MIETIILAFIIAKIRNNKLKYILTDWAIYPMLFFAFLYIILEALAFTGNHYFVKYTQIYKILYILSFIPMVVKYKQTISATVGLGFMITGNILNSIVMGANGGKMPVYPSLTLITGYADGFMDEYHMIGDPSVKLKALSDYIDLGYTIMSLGDVLVRIFMFLVLFYSIKHTNKVGKNIDFLLSGT